MKMITLEGREFYLVRGMDFFEQAGALVLQRVVASPLACEESHRMKRFGYLWNFARLQHYFGPDAHLVEGKDGRRFPLPPRMQRETPWIRLLDIDVGVTAMPFSARVGVSPLEAVDFLLGWFGLDIGRDDTPSQSGATERGSTQPETTQPETNVPVTIRTEASPP